MEKVKNLKLSVVLPIVSVIALLVKIIFHVDIGTDLQNDIASAVCTLIGAYGVLKGQHI